MLVKSYEKAEQKIIDKLKYKLQFVQCISSVHWSHCYPVMVSVYDFQPPLSHDTAIRQNGIVNGMQYKQRIKRKQNDV